MLLPHCLGPAKVCAKYTQLLVFSSTLLWFYFLGFLGFALFSWSFYSKLPKWWTVFWQNQTSEPVHYLSCFWLEDLIKVAEYRVRTKGKKTFKKWFCCWKETGHVLLWRNVGDIRTWDGKQHRKLYSELVSCSYSTWKIRVLREMQSEDIGFQWKIDTIKKLS